MANESAAENGPGEGGSVSEPEQLRFDPGAGTTVQLRNPEWLLSFDVENLETLDVVDVETERRDGELLVTDCTINLRNLAIIARELDTTERRLNRWSQSGWNPAIRTREP